MTTDVTNAAPAVAGHVFAPKPDITVHELATIFEAVLIGQSALFLPDLMTQIPEEMHPHFTKTQEAVQTGNILSLMSI